MIAAVALGAVLALTVGFLAWMAHYARRCAHARWTVLVSPGASVRPVRR